jgi:hypothetical protein
VSKDIDALDKHAERWEVRSVPSDSADLLGFGACLILSWFLPSHCPNSKS